MDSKEKVYQVGKNIEGFTLPQLQDAISELNNNIVYAEDLLTAINGADQKEIGASLFMWLCRYLELKIKETENVKI